MNSIIIADRQGELDDIIFSCGTILYSKNLYTARHLNCASPVENAYHSSKIGKQTTLIKKHRVKVPMKLLVLPVVL